MVRQGMNKFVGAKRAEIKAAFEAGSGDMQGDVEPVFIEALASKTDAVKGELREQGNTLEFRYEIVDSGLNDEEVMRIFHIAYLDVLTMHYWYNETAASHASLYLRLINRSTGETSTCPYPDPE